MLQTNRITDRCIEPEVEDMMMMMMMMMIMMMMFEPEIRVHSV